MTSGSTALAASIQAELDAVSADGGGEVRLKDGEYLVTLTPTPGYPGYFSGLTIPANTSLAGAARGATVIKLADGDPRSAASEGASIITNANLGTGDDNVTIRDLTVDGNAANQTGVHNGIELLRTRSARCIRVAVKNCRGIATSGAAETFHFNALLGADYSFTDCEVFTDDGGSTAAGFAANGASNVSRVGCVARGMTVSNGFTDYQSANVTHDACHAYGNANIGFNAEDCTDVVYIGCHAGMSAAEGADGEPFASLAPLGNTQGFVMNGTQRYELIACHARHNSGSGLVVSNDYTTSSGAVDGGVYSDNGYVGISISADPKQQRISPSTEVLRNTSGQVEIPVYGWIAAHALLAAPTIPGTDTLFVQPFPFDCDVYVGGGTVSYIQVNGATIAGIGHGLLRLRPGDSIQIGYSSQPSWTWFGA